jgi:hypothetical protein
MSEDNNFLSRWSRKKREAVEPPPQAAAPAVKDANRKMMRAARLAETSRGDQADGGSSSCGYLRQVDRSGWISHVLQAGCRQNRCSAAPGLVHRPAIRDYIGFRK